MGQGELSDTLEMKQDQGPEQQPGKVIDMYEAKKPEELQEMIEKRYQTITDLAKDDTYDADTKKQMIGALTKDIVRLETAYSHRTGEKQRDSEKTKEQRIQEANENEYVTESLASEENNPIRKTIEEHEHAVNNLEGVQTTADRKMEAVPGAKEHKVEETLQALNQESQRLQQKKEDLLKQKEIIANNMHESTLHTQEVRDGLGLARPAQEDPSIVFDQQSMDKVNESLVSVEQRIGRTMEEKQRLEQQYGLASKEQELPADEQEEGTVMGEREHAIMGSEHQGEASVLQNDETPLEHITHQPEERAEAPRAAQKDEIDEVAEHQLDELLGKAEGSDGPLEEAEEEALRQDARGGLQEQQQNAAERRADDLKGLDLSGEGLSLKGSEEIHVGEGVREERTKDASENVGANERAEKDIVPFERLLENSGFAESLQQLTQALEQGNGMGDLIPDKGLKLLNEELSRLKQIMEGTRRGPLQDMEFIMYEFGTAINNIVKHWEQDRQPGQVGRPENLAVVRDALAHFSDTCRTLGESLPDSAEYDNIAKITQQLASLADRKARTIGTVFALPKVRYADDYDNAG